MSDLNPSALAELRKHAEHIRDASSIVADGFVGQITPPAFMQINARAVLALLDRIEDLERAVVAAQEWERSRVDRLRETNPADREALRNGGDR